MKKLINICIVTIMAISLIACGKENAVFEDLSLSVSEETETSIQEEKAETSVVVSDEEKADAVIVEEPIEEPTEEPMDDVKITQISMGDVDNNGVEDYLTINGDIDHWEDMDDCRLLSVYLNNEKIYEFEDEIPIINVEKDFAYTDLNGDGKEELFISFEPLVNSMPLEEYMVLTNTGDKWQAINIDIVSTPTSLSVGNTLPISVKRKGEEPIFEISVEGYDSTILFDAREHYNNIIADMGDYEFGKNLYTAFLTGDLSLNERALDDGDTAAWGIWDIEVSEYDGETCLKALQGIQGPDGKFDYFGDIYVFFNYNSDYSLNILGVDFIYEE